jgi:hypothetical protein
MPRLSRTLARGACAGFAVACALWTVPSLAETEAGAGTGYDEQAEFSLADDSAGVADSRQHERERENNGWVEVSAFFPKVDSRLLITAADGPEGTEIDLERDLRLARRRTLPALSAGVRLDRSWSLFAEFYSVDRSREAVLDDDIVFDGVVYPASASIRSEFDSQIYRFGVSYSVFRDADSDVEISLGAHVTEFATSIEGEVTADGTTTVIERRRREVLAPLPTIGVFAKQEILPRLDLSLRADAFSLALGEFEGRIVNLQSTLSSRLAQRLSVGLTYRQIGYKLEVEKADWVGRAKYAFSGPAVSLHWTW